VLQDINASHHSVDKNKGEDDEEVRDQTGESKHNPGWTWAPEKCRGSGVAGVHWRALACTYYYQEQTLPVSNAQVWVFTLDSICNLCFSRSLASFCGDSRMLNVHIIDIDIDVNM